jgi:hypothetical protein
MKLPAETIYAALFKQICGINSGTTPLNVMSRRWRHWSKVGSAEMPAFFQMQVPGETQDQKQVFGLTRYELNALLFFYFPVNDADINSPIAPTLNAYFDAVNNIMAPDIRTPGGNKQQLGLLNGIENAWIRGTVIMDEGLEVPPALLVVPISIVSG